MSEIFFIVFASALAVAVIQMFFKHSRNSQRRIYWSCTVVGGVAAFLMVYPEWKKGSGIALFYLGLMIFVAYAYTPYIKIGGKIHALTVQDSRPDANETTEAATADPENDPAPDAYSGLLTATKMWWLLVPLLLISSINTYAFAIGEGDGWAAVIGIGFLVFLAVAMGFGDASWGYGIARGRHIQFGIATVITVGVFAVLYLVAYQAGKRWPLRRKQSMEYRAHPRHGKDD